MSHLNQTRTHYSCNDSDFRLARKRPRTRAEPDAFVKAHQSSSAISAYGKLKEESGIVLIATLVLLVTLTLIGVTAFFASSTNVKVGGNYRTGETALQIAMA